MENQINLRNLINDRNLYIVQGTVKDADGRALPNLIVRAFDRDLRSESVLGEAPTDIRGSYRITYTPAAFVAKEKKTADLFVRVFTPNGAQVFDTDFDHIIFNASDYETIDITISILVPQEGNEYDSIVRDIKDLIVGVTISELEETSK